jgi:hypothetical protein
MAIIEGIQAVIIGYVSVGCLGSLRGVISRGFRLVMVRRIQRDGGTL